MRSIASVTVLLLVLATGGVSAQLGRGVEKLIERSARTLEKSRDASERREAARTLGGFEVPEVVPPLVAALADSDASVRRQAADALWRVSEVAGAAVDALRSVLDDSSPGVRVRAAAALEALGVPEAELVAAREAGLGAEWLGDRMLAARDLVGFVPGVRLVTPIVEVAAAEAETVAYDLGERYLSPVDVLERLVGTEDRSWVDGVMAAIADGNPGRRWLLQGLAKLDPKPAEWNGALVAQLTSPRADDRTVALALLADRTAPEAGVEQWIEPVTATLGDPAARHAAAWALQRAKGYAALAAPQLARIVTSDQNADTRERAAEALAAIGERSQAFPSPVLRGVAEASLEALRGAAVGDPDDDVRGAALSALNQIWVAADEVLPTFLAAAQGDRKDHNRFKALQYIRNLGTGAASAAEALTSIAAADPGNRGMAEQALHAVQTSAPDFNPAVTTGPANAGTAAALAALRAAGAEFTPHRMWQAVSNLEEDVVRLFLDAGMSPDERLDDVGMRALHVLYFGSGCQINVPEVPEATMTLTRLLLERGADPNLSDDRGNTVLKMAANGCNAAVIRLLLAGGADMHAVDQFGMTAFELAIGISAFSGSDAPEAFLEAGFRLPADTAAKYRETYSDNPRVLELIRRARMLEAR